MNNEEFIILGSSGFVGSSIQYYISHIKQKHFVHFISRSKNKLVDFEPNLRFYSGCILDNLNQIILKAGKNKKFIIINLIGKITNDLDKLNDVEKLTQSFLSILNKKNTKRFLHISSSAVYDGLNKKINITEKTCPYSNTNYGKSKLNLENLMMSSSIREITTIIRVGNILGGDSLTKNFQTDNKQKKILEIYDDGLSALRTYIDPLNFSRLLFKIANKNLINNSVYNCGTLKPFFMQDVLKALNVDYEVTYSNNNKNQYFTLNINKISKELNNKLRYNLDEMASNTIAVINKQ